MKNKIILISLLSTLFLLVGCGEEVYTKPKSTDSIVFDRVYKDGFERIYKDGFERIYVDKKTSVVYYEKRFVKGGAMTVLYNEDGSVMTLDQFEELGYLEK